ncbi:MAG TPA: hypothetical protein VII45_05845 [Solirubrobacterales bacterium]
MDLNRLKYGETIAGASAILLFISMFFEWFDVKGNLGNLLVRFVPFGGGNAWQTLEVIPIFLVLAIAVALGSVLMRLAGFDWKPAVPANAAVTVFGCLASLLILTRMVSPPGSRELPEGFLIEPTLKGGIFFALVASLGIVLGGFLAMRAEGVTLSFLRFGRHRKRGRLHP